MTLEGDKRVLWQLSYGLYVVSSLKNGGEYNGQIANTVFQVSADPPRIVASINRENYTHEFITESGLFAVSILDQETPFKFIGLFGFQCGRDVDKCAKAEHIIGKTGCPVITENALSYIEAKVMDSIDVETHTLFIGEPQYADQLKDGVPMTYKYYHEVIKGKTPEKAATYLGKT